MARTLSISLPDATFARLEELRGITKRSSFVALALDAYMEAPREEPVVEPEPELRAVPARVVPRRGSVSPALERFGK